MKKQEKQNSGGIEADIKETIDGQFVCIHNSDTTYMTGVTLNVATSTLAELQALTITNGNGIAKYPDLHLCTLQDFLTVCNKYGKVPFIDAITFTTENGCLNFLNILKQYGVLNRCVISHYNSLTELDKIRSYTKQPIIQLNISGQMNIPYHPDRMEQVFNAGIGFGNDTLTIEDLRQLRKQNCFVGVWTVNNMSDALKYASFGVDYIVSDNIDSFNTSSD